MSEAALNIPAPSTPSPDAAPTAAPANDRAAAAQLFQQALGGAAAHEEPASPAPNGESAPAPPEADAGAASAEPPAAPAQPAPAAAPPPKPKMKNSFAQAREEARGLAATRQALEAERAAVAAERERLGRLAEEAKKAGQFDATQAQLHRELAHLLTTKPEEFVERLAKLTGQTEQQVLNRIQVRSTAGVEVDEAQRKIDELLRKQEETEKRVKNFEEQRKREATEMAERRFRADFNGAVAAITDIAAGRGDDADVEAWPELAATHPNRVQRDMEFLLSSAYRDVEGFEPTPAALKQIASALNATYRGEQAHTSQFVSRRSGKPTGPLSQANPSSPAASAAAPGTGTQRQPASATAGNGSHVDVAAAPTSGSRGELSDAERRSRASQLFQKALHGD